MDSPVQKIESIDVLKRYVNQQILLEGRGRPEETANLEQIRMQTSPSTQPHQHISFLVSQQEGRMLMMQHQMLRQKSKNIFQIC